MAQTSESKDEPSVRKNQSSENEAPQKLEQHARTHSQQKSTCHRVNVGDDERIASTAGGVILATVGMLRSGATGWLLLGIGASLVYRGTTGHCSAYKALGVNTAINTSDQQKRLAKS